MGCSRHGPTCPIRDMRECTLGVLVERVRHAAECTADHCQDRDAGLGVAIELCDAIEPLLAARDAALAEVRRDRDAYSTMLQSQAVEMAGARAKIERLLERANAAEDTLEHRNALVEELRARAEAAEKMRDELRRVLDENVIPRSIAAEKERDALRARLAAVLALTAEDVDRVEEEHPTRMIGDLVIDLIRSRAGASSGAEAPTGATV